MTTRDHSETQADKGSTGRSSGRSAKTGGEHRVLTLQRQAGNRAVAARMQAGKAPIPIQRELVADGIKGKLNMEVDDEAVARDLAFVVAQAGAPGAFGKEAQTKLNITGAGKGGGAGGGGGAASSSTGGSTATEKKALPTTDFSAMSEEDLDKKLKEMEAGKGAPLAVTKVTEKDKKLARARELEDAHNLRQEIFDFVKPAPGMPTRRLNIALQDKTAEQLRAKLEMLQKRKKERETLAESKKQLADLESAEKSGFKMSETELLAAKIKAKKEAQTKAQAAQLLDENRGDTADAMMARLAKDPEEFKKWAAKMPKGYGQKMMDAWKEKTKPKKTVATN